MLKRLFNGLIMLLLAMAIWLPCVHFFFTKPPTNFYLKEGVSPKARQLAARHLELWNDPGLRARELKKMRSSNAEWDFMGRSFLVWSLANMGLREPAAKAAYLSVMDQIIDETVRIEQEQGIYIFLMPYAKASPFVVQPARSLFIDGEIALMMGARRLLEERPAYQQAMTGRIKDIRSRLEGNPALVAESYPNECWMFDHAVALAAMKVADRLDGTDHAGFCARWLSLARQKLIHPESGLLVSSFTHRGEALDGPEGSSIWMVAHCLAVVDEPFARDQYQRARQQLGRNVLGFGYGREWPPSWQGATDIDSGPIIPGLQVSAGSSGLAFLGATTFGDWEYLTELAATLDMAAFPVLKQGRLKYCASNQVGDAALLYAAVQGPLWEKVRARQ